MKTFANILWLLFAGIWLFIGYVFAAVVMSLLIITIPFAIQTLKLAMFVIWPFGRTIVDRPGASVAASGCANVIWFIFGGWYIALIHVVTGLLLCIPIITIPFAVQNFKLSRARTLRQGDRVQRGGAATPRRVPRGSDQRCDDSLAGGPTSSGNAVPAGAGCSAGAAAATRQRHRLLSSLSERRSSSLPLHSLARS
jgi:uncharacterized membrane protein YccF (DUF307 family)